MTPDPNMISELRNLFKAGATPSRLVRLIVDRHGRDSQIDRLIREYFREAFCLPMFRASASLLTIPSERLPFAGINARTIHQIVERRAEWDQNANAGATWMDSLVATDEMVLLERASPEQSEEFATVWDQLEDSAKQYLKRLIGGTQYLSEKVDILSRLVEQLQAQVVAIECHEDRKLTPAVENRSAVTGERQS